MLTVLWETQFKRGKTAAQQHLGVRNGKEATRLVQKEGRRNSRRPTGEQAVPLQPVGTVWSRSSHAATKASTVQQWMTSRGGAHGHPHRSSFGLELQPGGSSVWGGGGLVGTADGRWQTVEEPVPEGPQPTEMTHDGEVHK